MAGHPEIEVLLHSQVTDVSGTVGRYTVSLTHSGRCTAAASFDVGAIVVATGAQAVAAVGPTIRYDGKRCGDPTASSSASCAMQRRPASVVMILCAGQRNEAVPYCSGVCCLGALQQALAVKAANPQARITVLFRDLNLQGDKSGEKTLLEARRAGVQFIRYTPSSPPQVTDDGVDVCDALTGRSCHVPCERVVLATPLVPQPDASVLAHLLGIAQDEHGFFPEVRYRLRPEELRRAGHLRMRRGPSSRLTGRG